MFSKFTICRFAKKNSLVFEIYMAVFAYVHVPRRILLSQFFCLITPFQPGQTPSVQHDATRKIVECD